MRESDYNYSLVIKLAAIKKNLPCIKRRNKMLLVRFCLIHGKKNIVDVAMGNGARGSKVPFSLNCASPDALLRSSGRVSVVVSV